MGRVRATLDNSALFLFGLACLTMHAYMATCPHTHMAGCVLEFTKFGLHHIFSNGTEKWKRKGKGNGSFAFRTDCSISILKERWSSSSRSCVRKLKVSATKSQEPVDSSRAEAAQEGEEGDDENYQVLMAVKSSFNDILILDTPKARILLLDSTRMLCLSLNNTDIKGTTLSDLAIYMYFVDVDTCR